MPDQGPTPTLFFDTINGFQGAAALKAAIDVKLFTAIGEGHDTTAKIAKRCALAERGGRILADYLTTLGFLTKRDGTYALTRDSAAFLDERSPSYVGAAVEFLHSSKALANFADLTPRVRRGGAPPEDEKVLTTDHDLWVRFARGMAGLMWTPAQALAKQVLAGSTATMKVLDIAAGHGLFGIAFAQQNPNARIVGQDWPHVLEVAKENATRLGVIDRYETLPGSALEISLGKDYEFVLLPNILHHFSPAVCEKLLRKVHAALKPGGRVATVDFIPNDDRVTPASSATFAMVMLANTPAGDAYTFKEYDQMFRNAGFARNQLSETGAGMEQVILSYK